MARRNEDESASDPNRREFFRTFGRDAVRNAGAVMGAAAELRRQGSEAARELLDLGSPSARAAISSPPQRNVSSDSAASFNSAYRLSGASLLILDQRDLPVRVSILTCREPSEVASAIRLGVVNAGPVSGELAAYAIALVAAEASTSDQQERDQLVRAAATTLRGARRDVRALVQAADRMEARYVELTADANEADGHALATALREEADAIASEAQISHAALGRAGADALSGGPEPINLLMHGDMGPLSCGMVGTGTAILQSLIDGGRNLHVWVTEVAPGMEGTRLAAFQLTQLDVPHTVIPDTAVSWLLATRVISGALLRGDTMGAYGDCLAPIGSLNVAQLATDTGVAVYVVAPVTSFAPPDTDPASLLFDVRSPTETGIRKPGEGASRPPTIEVRLTPTTDLVPPRLVTAFITDTGLRPGERV